MKKFPLPFGVLALFFLTVILFHHLYPDAEQKAENRIEPDKAYLLDKRQDMLLLKLNSDIFINIDHILKSPGNILLSESSPLLLKIIKSEMFGPTGSERHLGSQWNKGEQGAQFGQIGQVPVLVEYFKGKRDGVFIEAGAFDGVGFSNTLFLEVEYNWTGLLIEPEPDNFKTLKSRNRQAKIINSCISRKWYPEEVNFQGVDVVGKIMKEGESKEDDIQVKLQCYPLYSLMLAADLKRVDLLSLDIEGDEYDVLTSLPWDLVDIQALLIEVAHTNAAGIDSLLKSKGYRIEERFNIQDILYVKD